MLVIFIVASMLPSKLRALNECSTDESSDNDDAPVKVTKEALETKAELQYSQALQYLARDQLDEAEKELSRLLGSEIISSLNTTLDQKDKSQSLLAHLKYCCLTNLGNLLLKKSNYHGALTNYQEALKMDNTDLNLWYRLGLTHSKLYQTDKAISAFLEGIKCNPNHWPTLDKLITLLYASNEYVSCLHHISLSLNLDAGYLKGHFIKEIIFKKFPSLISYFKSYCSDGGLDIICTEIIDKDIQQRVLDDIEDIKKNDPTLRLEKTSVNVKRQTILYAKPFVFKSWVELGKWLSKIYDHLFENYDHSLLYEPIEFISESTNLEASNNYIIVDETFCEKDFENTSFKLDAPVTKRRKSSPSLADQLKLSRRSARNKANSKVNESSIVKSVWNIMPEHLLLSKDGSDKYNINSIKWSDDSMDTMDLYRLYEFSDLLSDGLTENLLKNNINEEERIKQINNDKYFGSDRELSDLNLFFEQNDKKSISDILEIYLNKIANKWSNIWPIDMVQVYIDIFKRVWIHTEKQQITYISDSDLKGLTDEQLALVKNEILSILTYGELLCDLYFQLKISNKPLEGSIIGGDFCSLWIGSINDALLLLNLKDEDHMVISIRFLWLKALFNLQDKETGLTCDVLEVLLNIIEGLDNYEIILPNLEYFYRINKRIAEKLVITLKRNNLLSTVKNLYESEEYVSVVDILKETLKPQSRTFMEIPSYQTMTRFNQYIYMLNSFLKLKSYHELFKWCEPCLYEAILQYRKSLIEDCDANQKTNQAEFINNIFYAMLESIKVEGLNVYDNLSQGYKSRLIQSVINLLSYLIETPDGNPEIDAVSPWLLLYNLLKHEELKNDESFSSQTSSIPNSLSLLFLGHEYLGKRSWCCFEDGILLFLTLSEIEPYIHYDIYNLSLVQQVDQIFYCLYTHLIKRNRPRHVQDHHSMGLALTWPRARQLVHFYQPLELPSYDGISKTFTVNSDIDAMLKKVIALIPEEINPNRLLDDLMAYIKGETDQLPVNDNPLPSDVKDIFYLMADYNFKNKTWGKAIRYYLLDLCNNLERFDSWAAMALARGSQIETKLNSCESIKNEGDIIRRAHMTGRCYKHSLKISPENTTLLIEYGTLTYSIHSFCSRLLKQETSNMSLLMFGQLEEEKEKMIKIARKCFETANNVWDYTDCDSQDERWMHHYVLGKIAEKNDDNSTLFMSHYLKAAEYLDSYGAKFPEHITYTAPQYYSIEVLEIYYRIHAGALKLLEKHDNQPSCDELCKNIEKVLDKLSTMPPISNKNKKIGKIFSSDMNNKLKKEDIDSLVKQTLNDIISDVEKFYRDTDNNKVFTSQKRLYIDNVKPPSTDANVTLHSKDDSNIPTKKMKMVENDSSEEDSISFRWKLIQRCLTALEDCIKRFPQHYKSYYRLAHFYFRSPSHKDFKKFKDLMFGERGLFVGQRPNNFFHGVWRIPVSEIDRPGSFAYHMSRCIHLLLDFLKETGDHKMLLDLAIQLKYTPDLEKKYLRDNERESISKEALFLSVQILRRLKSEYAKTNNRYKNELLLIQVYKSYKRVYKCWQQKDNTLSKLLLNVYQNIAGVKEDVSNDVIIKYCQKLQLMEKEIEAEANNQRPNNHAMNKENDLSSPVVKLGSVNKPDTLQSSSISTPTVSSAVSNSKSTSKSDTPQSPSTPSLIETPKQIFPQPLSHSLSNKQLPNQIMSLLAPCTQSPLMFPMSLEPCNYNITLQQKLLATKQKLKRSNSKQKIETKRSTSNKDKDRTDNGQLSNGKPKKSSSNKSNELKIVRNQKSSNIVKLLKQMKSGGIAESDKPPNVLTDKSKSHHNLNTVVDFSKVIHHSIGLKLVEPAPSPPLKQNKTSSDKPKTSSDKPKASSDKPKTSAVRPSATSTGATVNNVKPTVSISPASPRISKSVYIDLDSAAEQARLKSTILLNKNPEKKNTTPVSLSPAILLSSCPGLSITPVINTTNDNTGRKTTMINEPSTLRPNIPTSKNFNFEQLQQLGNSLTITKSEKNGKSKKQTAPELILID